MNSSLVWQLISETMRWQPDHDRLTQLAAQKPDISNFQSICSTHGLLPIVDKALGPVRQTLFTAEEAQTWRRAVASSVLGSLVMHRELQRLLQLFATAQIQIAPFKGPTLSERLYGDPVLRVYSDLDLLVAPDQVLDTVKLLIAEGYQPEYDITLLVKQMKPRAREIHFVMKHSSGNFSVELHWLLFNSWHRRKASPISIDEWLRADSTANEELLLYLCLHNSLHWWQQMKWVVDVDRCVRVADELDWHKLFATAKLRGCSRALKLGLSLASETCGLDLPESTIAERHNDPTAILLAQRIISLWTSGGSARPSFAWRSRYLLACRDSLSDRMRMIIDYALMRGKDFVN